MSADGADGVGGNDDPDPLPRVPDASRVSDQRTSTPLTETFAPGTAADPPVGTGESGDDGCGCGSCDCGGEKAAEDGEGNAVAGGDGDGGTVTVTVDGTAVSVPADATLLDAMERAEYEGTVPALCAYDRDGGDCSDDIGPRSTCRTCTVEADGELVPACSHPVGDGVTVRTDGPDAREARAVNLDLVLSDHNLRCTTCNQNGRCELQDAAIEAGVEEPRFGVFDERSEYEPLDDTSSFIQIDRNKCITCARCVDACNDVQMSGVLRIEGTGEDTEIGFQSDAETMADSACVSCGHCATVCPTGSLTERGLAGLATLPIPGFSHRNSVGKSLTADAEKAARATSETGGSRGGDGGDGGDRGEAGRSPTRERAESNGLASAFRWAKRTAGDAGRSALLAGEHAAESLAARTMKEGWLFDVASRVADHRLKDVEFTETTCGFCAVGCRFQLVSKDDEVLGAVPTDDPADAPVNDFSTCVKGKFGYEFANSDERLTTPLVRDDDGELREASWEEALSRVAEGFESIRERSGPDALATFASSKCTNEEDYLMQKFARGVLGTKNVDNCARLCHSSTVAALKQTLGYGAMSNRINEDIGEADAYLITGSNTTESHPVLATRITRNVDAGADLVVFDPREVEIAEHASQYVRTEPGYDVAWINGLIRYIVANDLHDEAFIEERTRNFDALREKVEPFTPEEVERLAGVPPEELREAAETIATADSVVFGWAMGMTQHGHGTQNVLALADLALVTGNLGKPGAGVSPFRGHNNVQGGGGDMGTLPNLLPGYRDPGDPDVLDEFEDAWGVRPPSEEGLTVPEVFTEALAGNVEGLYVMGENPALSEPDISHAEEALEALEFLVVQDVFPTETTEHADVVLPAATFSEKEGTFTNTERRVQLVGRATDPPGDARQDWAILRDLASRIDHAGDPWAFDGPADVMDEIATVAPIYGGISHERLRAEGGLQWPCEDESDPGTPYLYEEGFNFPDGRARFVPADTGEPGDLPSEEFPLTMTTGRVLYHWHTGTLTRRVDGLMDHVGEAFVEITAATAERLGIADGDRVRVESPRGAIEVHATVSDRPGDGVVFVPMHFADGAVNELTGERFDPDSGIPEYKVSSVRVSPVDADSRAGRDAAPSSGRSGTTGRPDPTGSVDDD
ncbi:formate dehydrogenase subunit alpha [Halobaculum sp. CBA1158]|uniref:formate dehydrogenase subunit alpha n=1 Tax=Halobaculum sp. CBA1158 TaxID=2904243 RepID=UPI001F335956|nr:formate dehydrogenase subunit alpha [Halobaculum sp. CBA1158]UIO98655.1 formate dehydrogenase subunit alpha [Halobaculum sp. CBA1158]